jgi:hypothetical protein
MFVIISGVHLISLNLMSLCCKLFSRWYIVQNIYYLITTNDGLQFHKENVNKLLTQVDDIKKKERS